jgi:hypothetical protein
MPNEPDRMYADEWLGWDDFLGEMRDYEEARAEVRKFGIQSQEEWWEFVDTAGDMLADARVPARPHLFYPSRRDQKWLGYDHWLSRDETVLYAPTEPPRPDDDYDDGYPSATA